MGGHGSLIEANTKVSKIVICVPAGGETFCNALAYVGIYFYRCVCVQWLYLPNGNAHWRGIANAVLDLRVPAHKVGCRRSRNSCDASSDPREPSYFFIIKPTDALISQIYFG